MAQPEFPAGVEIRPFIRADHARAVHHAQQEAFRDHWGFVEERPFDEWQVRFDNPHHDDALYFIAWEGDQVAGIAFCSIGQMGENDLGHVDILGVRRPWRGKGLGMALLRYAFCSFQGLGLRGSTLGVDAASKTNAVALYERAGMNVRRHAMAYRKVLRGNPADIVD
jgi:ribosomal protein S18 acetylase RimI-like enzyme